MAKIDDTHAAPDAPEATSATTSADPTGATLEPSPAPGSEATLIAPDKGTPQPDPTPDPTPIGSDATLIAPHEGSVPDPTPALGSDLTLIAPADGADNPSFPSAQALGSDATLVASPSELRRAALDAAVTGVRRHTPSHAMPTRIGRYIVIERLGEGGMGVVFAAFDPQLDRKVAIKLVRPAYTETSGDEAQARLLREAQALARLRHPNIVQVYEVGAYGEEVFVAMEFVAGVTLRTWQFKHADSWREILKVYTAAGRGLAEAHRAGLIHRDFKPDNVLVTPDGEARVLDFGLAARDGTPTAKSEDLGRGLSVNLTMTGALVGTPAYMSPEQHRGDVADVRSDVFAFSVSLFEALYGIRPFAGDTLPEICASLFAGEITPPPPFVKIPAWVRRAVYRGLRVNPDDRPQDMATVLKALSRDPARLLISLGFFLVIAAIIGALVLALRSAKGRQTLRDAGAKVRADFDHQRARDLSDELSKTRSRSHEAHFNAWLSAAAREQLERDPSAALAALNRLDPGGGSWAHARAVATEAIAAGVPARRWTTPSGEAVTAVELRERWLISADRSGALRVHDLRARAERSGGGGPAAELQLPAAIFSMSVAIVGDAKGEPGRPPLRIAAIAGNTLHLWDIAAEALRSDESHPYLAVALSPDGASLATGASDGRLRMTAWAGEEKHVYPTHAAPVERLAWSEDGSRLASAGDDGTVLLWNLSADTHLSLQGLEGSVRDLHFEGPRHRPPTRLYAASERGRGSAWILDTAKPRRIDLDDLALRRSAPQVHLDLDSRGQVSLRYDHPRPRPLLRDPSIQAIALRRDGRWAAIARGPAIELWDPRVRRGEALPETPQVLQELAESAEGRWIAGATQGGGLYLWDLASTPARRHVLRSGGPSIREVLFVGATLAISDELPGVTLWDLAKNPTSDRGAAFEGLKLPIDQSTGELALRAHGDQILTWPRHSLADTMTLFTAAGTPLWSTEIGSWVDHASLSDDGAHLVLAPINGPAELWRVEGGTLVGPPLQIGNLDARWLSFGHVPEEPRIRLAAAREPDRDRDRDRDWDRDGDGEREADVIIWEVDASGIGRGILPTPHVLYEERDLSSVSPDRLRSSLLLRSPRGMHLWQLDSATIHELPLCLANIREFAVSDDQSAVILVGNDRVSAALERACVVDLESGAYYRRSSHGGPWSWDGASRLASTYGGQAPELVTAEVPDERDTFRAWLRAQTDRTISLDDLAPPRTKL